MRIACIGGGPGGLYFAALMKQLDARHEVTVWERNAPDDTFGFGVVFSDETLGGIENADPVVYAAMEAEFARWDDIDVHYRDTVMTSGGHRFAAMDRKRLLEILRDRCRELGVVTHFRTVAPDVGELSGHYDLVLAADGINSGTRQRYSEDFGTDLERRHCRFVWLGTDLVFDAFKFYVVETEYGTMQIHGYPYSDKRSTFIVEMNDRVHAAAGFPTLGQDELPPGVSDEVSVELCERLFADILGDHSLIPNNSKWINFTTVRNRNWRRGNVVLLGDAAHTAHFSIGSGTKLAMEDALALAACLHERDTVPDALAAYEDERRPVVESTQRAAQASLEWFEDIERYTDQAPAQFAFNILTRSRRVTYDNLRVRDPEFVARMDAWFARNRVPASLRKSETVPPMFQPYRLGELEIPNRIVVSGMDMYRAESGTVGDFHLAHLGGKALGGAGLVMTEMVCVSQDGRITPGCAGLYAPEHELAWSRIVDFVHTESRSKIGVQLGHSGRKGSTRVMWDGIDQPLESGNWPVCAPSPLPYRDGVNQVPCELDQSGMKRIRDDFVAATESANRCGFDLVELHAAHGYLLSSFISPVTNQREDEYGGSLAARLRFPLEVFRAMRAVWPVHKPLIVRISASDWVEGGITGEDAVEIARAFAREGASAIDCSSGQVTPDEQPAFGRSYQTPFADRIRHELGVPTIAVGVISSYDDVNSILLAGRADLCALGRVHLYDPNWTLHAAADQEYEGPAAEWPDPWKAGSRRPRAGRAEAPKPRLTLVREGAPGTAHHRWRP